MAAKRKSTTLLHKEPVSNTTELQDNNMEDPYAGLMKDADKLKLMLLAWNYQNSTAARNGTEGPDLATVGGLWAQYQNALAMTSGGTKPPAMSPVKLDSPNENQDETNSSGNKDDDEISDDDSDDRMDQIPHDPERLKAFNMFVRLFVDENLDRMIPISKQPKEKIQAIIDSCTRQFPEFAERSRKRIRTYLKSCRRNKKARDGCWDNTSIETTAPSNYLNSLIKTSVENDSITMPSITTLTSKTSPSLHSGMINDTKSLGSLSSLSCGGGGGGGSSSGGIGVIGNGSGGGGGGLGLGCMGGGGNSNNNLLTTANSLYRTDFSVNNNFNGSGRTTTTTSSVAVALPSTTTTSQPYQNYFNTSGSSVNNVGPTDLSMKQQQRPPLLSHKLNTSEINAVRQLVTGYRESAAFLLRSADELEQLLLQQQ